MVIGILGRWQWLQHSFWLSQMLPLQNNQESVTQLLGNICNKTS